MSSYDWISVDPSAPAATTTTKSIKMSREERVGRVMIRNTSKSDPPYDESVPELPELPMEYNIYVENLRNEALYLVLETDRSDIYEPKKKQHTERVRTLKTNGFEAFASSYRWLLYNLPRCVSLKLLGEAWRLYPYKQFWELYAFQYNSYRRLLDFETWYELVPKTYDINLFAVDPQSYDPRLWTLPSPGRHDWRFVNSFSPDSAVYMEPC